MYIIHDKRTGKYFCKDHTKVILFELFEDAVNYLNGFANYSMTQAMTAIFENPQIVFAMQEALQQIQIEELPSEYKFETINFNDIRT